MLSQGERAFGLGSEKFLRMMIGNCLKQTM
jgi:hypothetical protein